MKTKFRVFDKKNKEHLDPKNFRLNGSNHCDDNGELLLDLDGNLRLALFPCGNGDNSADSVFNIFDDPNYIIQRSIGVQDKNGKDIYEGDLINFEIHGAPYGRERDYAKNAEVWYSDEDCMWCFYKMRGALGQIYWYSFADDIDRETIEVVGNIYNK
jgi:uncharacterized phage protein (TIGR01671 family)